MLIVDPEGAPRDAVQGLLTGHGAHLRTTRDVATALTAVRDRPADVVVIDARRPGIDAPAACRLLRSAPATATTPILLIGPFASADAIDIARDAGATDVLRSPFEPALLRLRVDALLALARARSMQREASELLASMGYEIRTPMTAILGMSHLALQSGLDARQRNYVEKVERSAETLLATLNDILDFSSIGAGTLVLRQDTFGLAEVLDGAARLVSIQADAKGLELLIDAPADLPSALIGDGARLRQVLIDLGLHAVRTAQTGEVVLGIECIAREACAATLRFTVRVDVAIAPPRRDVRSTVGLENTISAHLIGLMNTALFERDRALGFDIRFDTPETASSAAMPLAADASRVLIVDDSTEARRVLTAMCRSLGLRPDAAADGWDAMRQVALARQVGRPYGLVLIDAQMPGLDGTECARMIATGAAPPPLMLMARPTARDDVRRRLAARQVNVRSVLAKPLTPALLRSACAPALHRADTDSLPLASGAELMRLHREQLRGARLLLVEDNAIIQEVALELLGSAGIEVRVAHNGKEALQQLATQRFDAVLMDCHMPVMDGFAATRALRALPHLQQLPVIALTADSLGVDRARVIQAGMNDHIAKPLDVGLMFATLARWVHPATPPVPAAAPATPVVADDDPLARLPGIDAQVGRRSTMSNDVLYRRLLGMFLEGQRHFATQFRTAHASGDGAAATRLAHNLRAVSGSLGALAVQHSASALEQACARGDNHEAVAALLGHVITDLDPVIAGLTALR